MKNYFKIIIDKLISKKKSNIEPMNLTGDYKVGKFKPKTIIKEDKKEELKGKSDDGIFSSTIISSSSADGGGSCDGGSC